MQEIDILRLERLQQRRKTGQEVAQGVAGFGSVALLVAYGGRAMLVLLVMFVVLSLLMFRGYRWAGLTLYGLAFSLMAVILGQLGYYAFFHNLPADFPFRTSFERQNLLLFQAAAAVSFVAGWFLLRGVSATVEFSRLLPPLPVNTAETARAWLGVVRRFLSRWQAWLLLIVVLLTASLAFHRILLFILDLALFERMLLSNWLERRIEPLIWWTVTTGVPIWVGIFFIPVLLFMLLVLVRAYGRIRQYLAEASAEALRRDPRPPVLLLRSFADDQVTVWPSNGWHLSTTGNTMERTLERVLRSVGPVIAIGHPGETLPALGAAREYLAGGTWRERVRELIEQAQRIVVVMGESEGLAFEYELLAQYGALSKTLLIVPPGSVAALTPRWERFTRHALNEPNLIAPDLGTAIVVLFPDGRPTLCIRHSKRRGRRIEGAGSAGACVASPSIAPLSRRQLCFALSAFDPRD